MIRNPLPELPASPRIFMMDLWATVPYYTAYLSRALLAEGANVQIGSITYYLDPSCFSSRGLKSDPGLLNIVGRFRSLPRILRRIGKLTEGLINLAALTLRFLFRPPDVVHVQFLPMLRSRLPVDLWFVRFCRFRGAKIVLTVHDLLPHDTAQVHKQLYSRLYREMDVLICHSDHIRTRLQDEFGIQPEKIHVIPHGPFFFDLPEQDATATLTELGVETGQQMVLWQGIIFPYKGVDLLLDAWRLVEEQAPNVCLVVLGTGDPALTSSFTEKARELGLERVRFHFRFCSPEELVASYRAAAAVVYPYRAITTSGALATGLSLGKAIVASDLPVFRELLTNRESGLLVDPSDSDSLAAAIVSVIDDRQLREHLARNVVAMQFGHGSWQSIARETLRAYMDVLDKSQPDLCQATK